MALPDELAVADIVWSIESGQEIAVNRIYLQHHHISTNTFGWSDALKTIADKCVDAILNSAGPSGTTVRQTVHSTVLLSRVDAYALDTTGHATDKATSTPTAGTNNGGMGGSALPPQLAPIVQLWAYSGYAIHARRRRGRVFAPPPGTAALSTGGRLDDGWRQTLADGWSGFLNDLQGVNVGGVTSPGTHDYMNVGVLSRVDQAFYQLENISVAKDVGVQRRRINKLARPQPVLVPVNH